MLLPHPHLQTFYPPFTHFVFPPSSPFPPPHISGCFPIFPAFFESGVLSYSLLSGLILWILSVTRNPRLTHLPLSKSPDTLLCDLITHSQPGILSPDDPRTGGGVIIFVRQGLSFSELSASPFSLLDPYICRGQHLTKQLLIALSLSLSPECLCSLYLLFFFEIAELITFPPPFFSPPKIF